MASRSVEGLEVVRKVLETSSEDELRSVLGRMLAQLMEEEVRGVCNAGLGERSPERAVYRNGYR